MRTLRQDLGLPNEIQSLSHEALMSVVVTAWLCTKEGDQLLRPMGLTDAQLDVLMLLAYQAPEGALAQSSLGRMLVVNRSNVSGLVDRMERAGLVVRDPGEDRRVKRVRLTAKGRRLLQAVERPYMARVERVMAHLTAAERRELCRLLGIVRAGLRPAG